MPNDVPPRPGSPGYDEFIAHGKSSNTNEKPAAETAAPQTGAPQTGAPQTGAPEAKAMPQPASPEHGDAVSGGLY
jgi:hypothetical protein